MKKLGLLATALVAGALSFTGALAQQGGGESQDRGDKQQRVTGDDPTVSPGAPGMGTTSQPYSSAAGQSGQSGMSGQSAASGAAGASDQSAQWTQDQQVVRQVQQALNQQGFDVGSVDGVWGDKTRSALRDFQQQKGMQASGQLDQQTLAALGVDSSTMSGSSGAGSADPGSQMGSGSGQNGASGQQPSR